MTTAAELGQRIMALRPGEDIDWLMVREEISDRYPHASTRERVTLLRIYTGVMDAVERHLISDADLETFRRVRRQHYKQLLISECLEGDGAVSPEAMEAVTRREIEAGRMTPDNELRRLAVIGPAGVTPLYQGSRPLTHRSSPTRR